MLANAVQAQRDNISNLIVLDFCTMALLTISNAVVAHFRFAEDKSAPKDVLATCLKLGSIQQVKLLAAKLCNKKAFPVN